MEYFTQCLENNDFHMKIVLKQLRKCYTTLIIHKQKSSVFRPCTKAQLCLDVWLILFFSFFKYCCEHSLVMV